MRHADWIQPIGFLDKVSPQYDPIRSSDGCKFGMRYFEWRDCYLKISMAKQLLPFGTFVVQLRMISSSVCICHYVNKNTPI